ncbi:MAG: galactonate dehydratase [Opitutaceae bacterium]
MSLSYGPGPRRGNMVIVRITTSDGLEGYGEGTIPHKARAIAGAVEDFAEYLHGQDASMIERHWQVIFRNSFHRGGAIQSTALSAIDQALWDLAGKRLNVPVWQLLGGAVRDRILLYSHPGGSETSEIVERSLARVDEGYRALKLQIPGTSEPIQDLNAVANTVRNVAAVREAVGPNIKLMVDAHGKQSPSVALDMARALVPFDLLFFEEPIFPGNNDSLKLVADASPIPIAVGERLYNRWDFRPVIESQAAAVLQPDLGHAGGISEVRRIASMAEPYLMYIAPHNPRGPIVTMSSLHIAGATPNFLVQETAIHDSPIWEEMLVEPLEIKDGYVALPKAPGLGIKFDESLAERFPFEPRDVPHPVLLDGGVGDW